MKRKDLLRSAAAARGSGRNERLRLTPAELLRLQASSVKPLRVEGSKDRSEFLERFLQLRPSDSLVVPEGLDCELRPYQVIGLEWLKFLYENRLAGLALRRHGPGQRPIRRWRLMVMLREQHDVKEPFPGGLSSHRDQPLARQDWAVRPRAEARSSTTALTATSTSHFPRAM